MRRRIRPSVVATLAALVVALASACSDDDPVNRADHDDPTDDPTVKTTCPALPTSCVRPARAEGLRRIVISHPYAASGAKSTRFEVLELSTNGVITRPGKMFDLGRAVSGTVHFTPDGELGLVAQEDGTIGVFRVTADGDIEVIEAAFVMTEGAASDLVITPDGQRVYVVSAGWRNVGGGIFALRINCDGHLVEEGLVIPSKLPGAMAFLPGRDDVVVLSAVDALTAADGVTPLSKPGDDLHLISCPSNPTLLAGADLFPDDEAFVTDLAITPDGRWVMVSENNEFNPKQRLAVARLSGASLTRDQVLEPLDPLSIVFSPFGNGGLVTSGYGDAVLRLAYDSAVEASPFFLVGPFTYVGQAPQLPADAVVIERGVQRGLVLVSELSGVRAMRFTETSAADVGLFSLGGGVDQIVGAIGVQP